MGGGIFKSMPQSISSFTSVSDDKNMVQRKRARIKRKLGGMIKVYFGHQSVFKENKSTYLLASFYCRSVAILFQRSQKN